MKKLVLPVHLAVPSSYTRAFSMYLLLNSIAMVSIMVYNHEQIEIFHMEAIQIEPMMFSVMEGRLLHHCLHDDCENAYELPGKPSVTAGEALSRQIGT